MEAVKGLNLDLINILIENNADVNARDNRNWTALMYVANNGSVEVVDFLIKSGAKINIQDNGGQTALMRACMHNKQSDVVKTLIKHGANVKVKDKDGKTALDYAKDNPYIYRTDAYWLLNDKMYE